MGKLQEVEGIIKGMLMTLDIRIGTDIVVIKSSSLLLNLVYSAFPEGGNRMLQIPQNYIHTRSTPFWNKQTAPAGIFERHLDKGTRPGVYPRLSVMHGAVKYLGYADEHSAEPDQVILIEAGQFAVFPPEKWHNIEAMTDDTYFNIDFFVAPEVLMEGAQQRKVIHNGK